MNRKLKLAIIVHGGINSGHKGQGIPSLMDLLKKLNAEADLTIYTLSKPTTTNELQVKYVPGYSKLKYVSLMILLLFDHLSNRYDVVQAFWGFPSGFLATLLTRFFSIASVVTLMGGETANLPAINYGALRTKKGMNRIFRLLRSATRVVAISNYQKECLEKVGFQEFSNFEVIPFGVQHQDVSKRTVEEPFLLIKVANINLIKDHLTLLRAFKLVLQKINVQLLIVGGDFINNQVHSYVKEEGLSQHVTFTGIVNNQEALDLIKKSDLMVISSLSEGQAVVFNEAMASGVPVCSTEVGLMKGLSGYSCLTSTAGEAEALARNIEEVLTNKSLYEQLSNNGLEWTKKNNLQVTVGKYMKIYQDLAKK